MKSSGLPAQAGDMVREGVPLWHCEWVF